MDGGVCCRRSPCFFYCTRGRICKTSVPEQDWLTPINCMSQFWKTILMANVDWLEDRAAYGGCTFSTLLRDPRELSIKYHKIAFDVCGNSPAFADCKQATLRTKVPASGKREDILRPKGSWSCPLVPFTIGLEAHVTMCQQLMISAKGDLVNVTELPLLQVERYCCFRWCIVTTVSYTAQVMKCLAVPLWEAFHPSPASSGRSSSTVVGQMRNTPLSSLGCQQSTACRLSTRVWNSGDLHRISIRVPPVTPVQPPGYCDTWNHLKV